MGICKNLRLAFGTFHFNKVKQVIVGKYNRISSPSLKALTDGLLSSMLYLGLL